MHALNGLYHIVVYLTHLSDDMVVGDVGRVVAGLIDSDVVELLHCRILDEELNQKEIQIKNAPLLHLSRSKVFPEILDKIQ